MYVFCCRLDGYNLQQQTTMIPQFLLYFGCLLILHAAYSLQQYRSLVQDLVESTTGTSINVDDATTTASSIVPSHQLQENYLVYRIPPFDIYVELSIAFAILLLSEFIRSGSSFQRAVIVKGSKTKQSFNTRSIVGPPFISRDYDIYTTRKSKLS